MVRRWSAINRRAGLVAGLASAAAVVPLAAQEAMPAGRTVINRYIEAIGGREVILRQSGRHITGKFEIPAQGMGGDLEIYGQPPNRILVKVSLAGIGSIQSGYDGTTGWAVNPMMGPMVLDSLQLQQMKQQADFYANLYPEASIASLETVADTTFDSTPSYKVKVVTTWGEEYFEFFDKAKGLQVGSIRNQASPMGNMEISSVVSDYRLVEGLLVPFKQVQRTMGIEQVITVLSVEVMTVPDSVFALPPEIRALMK
jgi:hypothetical protein